jgi:hypothetical protein
MYLKNILKKNMKSSDSYVHIERILRRNNKKNFLEDPQIHFHRDTFLVV